MLFMSFCTVPAVHLWTCHPKGHHFMQQLRETRRKEDRNKAGGGMEERNVGWGGGIAEMRQMGLLGRIIICVWKRELLLSKKKICLCSIMMRWWRLGRFCFFRCFAVVRVYIWTFSRRPSDCIHCVQQCLLLNSRWLLPGGHKSHFYAFESRNSVCKMYRIDMGVQSEPNDPKWQN